MSELNALRDSPGVAAPRRRARVHADVLDRLRDMVVRGRLQAGERINEVEVAEQLEVSRTPVREALKVLAAEGLVELLPNRGSRVTSPSSSEIQNLFAVIAALERLAVETVVQQAPAASLAQLRALHDEMLQRFAQRERVRYLDLNHRIHGTIIELAGNPQLSRTHADLMTRARRPRFIAITSDARWAESVKEHELVMTAMELRDARFAGEILFRHVLKTGLAYIDSMARQLGESP